jgi:hypothetical protein
MSSSYRYFSSILFNVWGSNAIAFSFGAEGTGGGRQGACASFTVYSSLRSMIGLLEEISMQLD